MNIIEEMARAIDPEAFELPATVYRRIAMRGAERAHRVLRTKGHLNDLGIAAAKEADADAEPSILNEKGPE